MIENGSRYMKFVEAGVAVLLIAYPSLTFAIKGGMNGAFLFLLLLSLGVLVYRPHEMKSFVWDRDAKFYLLAMSSLPVAILLSQTYHQHYSGHPYDAASRFLLAVPIFMLLQRVRFNVVAMVQYGFPLAAIVGCLMIKPIALGRFGISTMDLIHFGDFSLVLGVLSVLSINWTGRDAVLIRVLKIAGFLAGIYASIVSGSRGGWICLPVFLIIYIYFRFGKISLKAMLSVTLILIISGFFSYTLSQEIHHRVDEVVSDLSEFRHGNFDTSMGVRLQLYRAAVQLSVKNPVFGVGVEGFAREMDPMQKAGDITHLAAEGGKGEVHNEILSKTVALGVFGLIAILSIYLAPFRIFYRAMRGDNAEIRQAGMMGLVFVSGFMFFGLTVEVLNLTMAAAFYGLTVAVLLGECRNSLSK